MVNDECSSVMYFPCSLPLTNDKTDIKSQRLGMVGRPILSTCQVVLMLFGYCPLLEADGAVMFAEPVPGQVLPRHDANHLKE